MPLALGALLSGLAPPASAQMADLHAWVAPGAHDRLFVVVDCLPFDASAEGFAADVRYEVHLADATRPGLPDHATYLVEFRDLAGPSGDPADPGAPAGGGQAVLPPLSGAHQTYTVVRVREGVRRTLVAEAPVAPPDLGPRTNLHVHQIADYDDAFAARFIRPLGPGGADGRVWAGPRDDGAYVDRAAIADLLDLPRTPANARDGHAGLNRSTIALEFPIAAATLDGLAPATEANGRIGVWASASRRKARVLRPDGGLSRYGPWTQISRVGLPFVETLLIGVQDRARWNARRPGDDAALFGAYYLEPVLVRDAEAVGLYAALGVPPEAVDALRHDRTDLLAALGLVAPDEVLAHLDRMGDVLRVNLWRDSFFPDGRALTGGPAPDREPVDAADWMLTRILTGGALSLGDFVDANDRPYLPELPFQARPHPARP